MKFSIAGKIMAGKWFGTLLAGVFAINTVGLAEDHGSVIKQGKYLLNIAGCITCHTDTENNGVPLAGGKELKSSFGTFFTPNITSDNETGIGRWNEMDFIRALQHGLSPNGEHYYPAFPYASYTFMSRKDVLSIFAYLKSLPPVKQRNREHKLGWPASDRSMLGFWKNLNFRQGAFRHNNRMSPAWNRGRYLVDALAHCGECHTPRFSSGGAMHSRYLAGGTVEAEDKNAPNITRDRNDGIGGWSKAQLIAFLASGITPEMRTVNETMQEVINGITSKLDNHDLQAMAEYLMTVPPIPSVNKYGDSNPYWWLEPTQ